MSVSFVSDNVQRWFWSQYHLFYVSLIARSCLWTIDSDNFLSVLINWNLSRCNPWYNQLRRIRQTRCEHLIEIRNTSFFLLGQHHVCNKMCIIWGTGWCDIIYLPLNACLPTGRASFECTQHWGKTVQMYFKVKSVSTMSKQYGKYHSICCLKNGKKLFICLLAIDF